MKLENLFVKTVISLMKIILTVNKMSITYFRNVIINSNDLLLNSSLKFTKKTFISPFNLFNFGSKTKIYESINLKCDQEIWYLLTGRSDNLNKILQVKDSIENINNVNCNLLANTNPCEAMELVESILQAFYPLKTKFISYCCKTIKDKIQNTNVKKVKLIVKSDESLLLKTILNQLSNDDSIKSYEFKKIEYYYFNENKYQNVCYT